MFTHTHTHFRVPQVEHLFKGAWTKEGGVVTSRDPQPPAPPPGPSRLEAFKQQQGDKKKIELEERMKGRAHRVSLRGAGS